MPEITAERVCKVLEGMYLLDLHERDPKRFADDVYTFCHIARGTCNNPHEDWQQQFLKMEEEILRAMESPAAKTKRAKGEES